MRDFTVEIPFDKAFHLRIKGSATPLVPARTNCAYEDAKPAEGGVEDIQSVELIRNGEVYELPTPLADSLLDDACNGEFDEKILKALSECEEDYE